MTPGGENWSCPEVQAVRGASDAELGQGIRTANNKDQTHIMYYPWLELMFTWVRWPECGTSCIFTFNIGVYGFI